MRETEAIVEARRLMVICNACRYCEGYCAVFPAMELRRGFSAGDLSYLANLCHDCRGCYYACQYAPPHEFALNLPQTLAKIRTETYEEYAWPRSVAGVFQRNGMFVSLLTALAIALVLVLATWLQPSANLYAIRTEPGAFYAVIPEAVMISVGVATFGFAILALAMGSLNFWRDTGGGTIAQARPLFKAAIDVLTLRNLGGGGHGCNNRDEAFSQARRIAHQALFYGFLFCFASTTTAAFYEHVLGLLAPYPFFSFPVVLGTAGGAGMLVGIAGLVWVKLKSDPAPAARALLGADYALLALLSLSAATGLVLLALRDTGAMGIVLALHLGVILSIFLTLPYSKFVHGIYRSAALLRHAAERTAE
ncbi:MAG: tricarballylate utilization 4Fe-4S protein TcuB [Candidatus Acidiferrales bacterium]